MPAIKQQKYMPRMPETNWKTLPGFTYFDSFINQSISINQIKQVCLIYRWQIYKICYFFTSLPMEISIICISDFQIAIRIMITCVKFAVQKIGGNFAVSKKGKFYHILRIVQLFSYWLSFNLMFIENSKLSSENSALSYQSKYLCKICFQRAKFPITCTQCKYFICKSHLKSIHNRCPFCRLEPFSYLEDNFLCELIQHDKKREREYLISNHAFKCLVEGCSFEGKYHKMDLHRRKCHRNQNLNEILFPQQRENAKKVRALQSLMRTLHEKQQQNSTNLYLAICLHRKTGGRVEVKLLYSMIMHIEQCKHLSCKKIYTEQTMCFIGNDARQLSECSRAQEFLTFYDH